jgi:hypothetical protein
LRAIIGESGLVRNGVLGSVQVVGHGEAFRGKVSGLLRDATAVPGGIRFAGGFSWLVEYAR